jgi:hypothetical protein
MQTRSCSDRSETRWYFITFGNFSFEHAIKKVQSNRNKLEPGKGDILDTEYGDYSDNVVIKLRRDLHLVQEVISC